MIYDVQNLSNSKFEILKKFGHLLYNREDQDGGLSKEEVYKLLKIFDEINLRSVYKEGFEAGLEEC